MSNARRYLIWCALPALVFYAVSLAELRWVGFSFVEILRDPAQQTDQSSFLGFLSNIGTWLWVSAASIAFFGAIIREERDRYRRMLVLVGAFSAVLAVDDFFLIHDRFIAEGIMVPLYAIFLVYLLVKYRPQLVQADAMAFVIAGGMMAGSILVDTVQEILFIPYEYSQVLEEGLKFMGAATWLYFCGRAAARHMPEG